MPELPDVELFKRHFDRSALRHRITNAAIHSDRILEHLSSRNFISHLRGHHFEKTRRHGKYLFAELDDHNWVVFHFGMTGRFESFDGEPPRGTQLSLDLDNREHLALVMPRKLGRLDITPDPENYIAGKGLGIDALDRKLTFARFRDLARKHNGAVKCWLMNQASVAGLGNIYTDEVMFQAGMPPDQKLDELDENGLKRLYSKIHEVVETAIKRKANPEQMPGSYLLPRRKEGAECPQCDGTIKKIKACGRTAYYCPHCQPS